MADVYIPQAVWSYISTFIPLPKVKYNKVGFYLFKDEDKNKGEIVHIKKITKCFMWFRVYEINDFNDLNYSSNQIRKEN